MSTSLQLAGGIVVDRAADGRTVHTFRQSTLNDLDICPERGRAKMAGLVKRETDAAAVGTAVHAGIEAAEHGLLDGLPLSPDEMVEVAHGTFDKIITRENFEWVKYTEATCRRLIDACLDVFDRDLYPRLAPKLIEHRFGPIVIHEDEYRIIQIEGTVDLLDGNLGMVDYKTTGQGRRYSGFGGEAWQLDRWAVQPTVYSAALRAEGHLDPDGPWRFTYFAFELGPEVDLHEVTVIRRSQDLDWLVDKTVAYALLIEADMSVWPRQDNHALCSPVWCDWWYGCKGGHYIEVDWPLRGE